jgi:hypothetical protein
MSGYSMKIMNTNLGIMLAIENMECFSNLILKYLGNIISVLYNNRKGIEFKLYNLKRENKRKYSNYEYSPSKILIGQ